MFMTRVWSLATLVPAGMAMAEPQLTTFVDAPGGRLYWASNDGSTAYFGRTQYYDQWSYMYTYWEWRRDSGEYRQIHNELDRWLDVYAIANDGRFAVFQDNWEQGWKRWDTDLGVFTQGTGLRPIRYTADETAFVAQNSVGGLSVVTNGVEVQCPLDGYVDFEFADMRPDASLVLGTAVKTSIGTRAFLWIPGQHPVFIEPPAGIQSIRGVKILADGSVVVGRVFGDGQMPYYRWTAQTGHTLMTTLYTHSETPHLPAFNDAGTMAVGASPIANAATMIWSAAHGTQTARDYLEARGADLAPILDLTLVVRGMSPDGRTMWGYSRSGSRVSKGWLITELPEPCAPDFNNDGFVDFFDYDDFVSCFEGGACPPGRTADFTGDAFVDFFDYDEFVIAFEYGC